MEFEINLLTSKKSTIFLKRFLKTFIFKKDWALLLLVLSVVIILLLSIFYVKSITRKTGRVVSAGYNLLGITLEKQTVSGLVKQLQQLQQDQIIWFKKLKSLGEIIPDQIFLTSMEVKEVRYKGGGRHKQKDSLVIKGVINTLVGEDSASYIFIQKFMKDLKNNPSFMEDFEDPILVSVSNRQKGKKQTKLDFEFHLLRKNKE